MRAPFQLALLATVAVGVGVPGVAAAAEPSEGAAGVAWEPTAEELRAYRELMRARRGYEVELKQLRAKYFRGIRNEQIRQIGLRKLREYTDPGSFALLTELFFGEGEDARAGVLAHLASLGTREADAAIAWEAVYADKADDRAASAAVLEEVAGERGSADLVRDVVRSGLRESAETPAVAAAQLAASLKLFEMIPQMAAAQVAAGGGGDQRGDLAWIFVGSQRPFVSDVQPVVSDGAVAFDPQLSVVSEGVILRVSDAYVAVYRVGIHKALLGMTTEAWGRSTASLGYDTRAWHDWYAREFVPFLRAKRAAELEAAQP